MYSYFDHPNKVCMSYFEHFKLSLGFSKIFLIGTFKAIIHAFIPSLYITSTSDLNKEVSLILSNSGCRKHE